MPSRTFPTIPSLVMWTKDPKDGKEEQLPSNSTRYQIIERCIHRGLQLLETPGGRDSLVKTAQLIIQECEKSKKHSHLFAGKPPGDLPKYINHFLTCMRTNFPIVRVNRLEGEAFAMRMGGMNDMNKFNPKVTGDLYVNSDIVHALLTCSQKGKESHVLNFEFQFTISIAHEIVHFMYGFLTGENAATVHTPKGVVLSGFNDGGLGESGRYWEGICLGGVVEMWSIVNEPLGNEQSGEAYIFEHGRPSARGWIVSPDFIKRFVKNQVALPIPKVGQTKTRDDLKGAQRQEMTRIRFRKRSRNDTGIPNPSPPRGGPAK